MSGRKLLTGVGAVGGGAVIYYLYNAGGSPSVAEKQFEHDAAQLSSKVKGELPGKGKEIKKTGELYGKEAGQAVDGVFKDAKREADKFDRTVQTYGNEASRKIDEYKKDAREYGKEAREEFNKKVDAFDRTVTQKAAESKGWFSGWFGK